MLNITFKVLAIIFAFLMLMLLFMPSGGMSKWKVAGITLGCFGVVAVLTLGIYLILMLRRDGFYRYRYEMMPEGVNLLMEEADIKSNMVLGTAAAVIGTASGHPLEGAASSMSTFGALGAGYTSFKSVKKIVIDRNKDCICLKLLVGENCVYVRNEDFDFVKDYIESRVDKS